MKNGTLEEARGTGTAAVISPVGILEYQDKKYEINNKEIGSLTKKLYEELTGIQWGLKEDVYNWCYEVK